MVYEQDFLSPALGGTIFLEGNWNLPLIWASAPPPGGFWHANKEEFCFLVGLLVSLFDCFRNLLLDLNSENMLLGSGFQRLRDILKVT